MRLDLEAVVATDPNWGIGSKGTQSIVLPGDRRRFRELTKGHTVIAGMKTFHDFPGQRPLSDRKNIILTRSSVSVPGALVAHSVKEAMKLCENDDKVFVIGGESVYRQFLPYCRKAHITRIQTQSEDDVFFPDLSKIPGWSLARCSDIMSYNNIYYIFQTWVWSAGVESL